MDKQTVIGFILIAVLFMAWMYFTMPDGKQQEKAQTEAVAPDTAKAKTVDSAAAKPAEKPAEAATAAPAPVEEKGGRMGKWFSGAQQGQEQTLTVVTDLYTAEFTTVGGGIKHWTLNKFTTWDKQPLQLIDWDIPSDPNLLLTTSDGKIIDTKSDRLYFRFSKFPESGRVTLADSAEFVVELVLPVPAESDSAAIIKRYTLKNGRYNVGFDIELRNLANVIANNEYWITINSINHTEHNSIEEASFSEANAAVDQDRINMDASSFNQLYKENKVGNVHWIATHNKYFLNALIAKEGSEGKSVTMEGRRVGLPDNGAREIYTVLMMRPYDKLPVETAHFTLFIGPMEYDLLKTQHEGLEQVMNLGWAWIVRPFSEYLIIPLFTVLHKVIPNYGIVIILFTLIIKGLLYPLTKKSMGSMRKMQALQPLMNEIREKYKDDSQRQNVEIMKLYKDYGVNPAGGCLPLLLQMPILFALFAIFRSTIELRQQPFFLWIHDLAAPDIILHFPFTIPLVGITDMSGLAMAMAITMFIQQKQTVTDPRQKSMVYVMPIMFWIMFNGFPAGLNLYYFVFNLLSIGQQYYINKKHANQPLEKVKPKKARKTGWAEKALQSLQQQQQKNAKK